MDLKTFKLGDICDTNRKSIGKKDSISSIKYLDTSNIVENKIEKLQLFKLDSAPSRAKRRVCHNTIVYSTVRPIQKHYGLLKYPDENLIVSTGFTTIDIKETYLNLVDADFLYYFLTLDRITCFLHTLAEGSKSSYPSIKPSDLENLDIYLPDINCQRQIVSILSPIDRKIALNRSINQNLEALAKQIYDYWFVQFDFPDENGRPYKSSGGKMVWNEVLKREVPEGWEVKKLGEIIAKLDSGKRPAGGIDKNLKTGIPSLGAECIDKLGVFDFSSTPYMPIQYRPKLKCGRIENNDILIYKDGAYVGKTTLFRDNFPFKEAFVNEHVFLLHTKNRNIQEYVLYTLQLPAYFEIMQRSGKKAAQPGLNQDDIKNILILLPPENIVSLFCKKIDILHKKIFANSKNSAILTNLRDELLPLLMNGQVTIE